LMISFDLNKGPIDLPSILPKLEAFLRPIILNIKNKEIILINSKKYLMNFI